MTSNDFFSVLEGIKFELLQDEKETLSKISDIGFEKLFAEKLTSALKTCGSDIVVEYREGSIKFPDIGCPPYGIEIKTTASDKWVSLGNSIMEGTKRNGMDEIFVVFLKKGGDVDIAIKTLNACISDIKITHSPRYEIDMDIKTETIFEKMHTNYDEFSTSKDKITNLRKYYKDKGSKSWWLDDDGERAVSMEIVSFSSLSKEDKEAYLVELFVLFPQMLSSEYDEAALYMITRHNIFDKSFRDKISAGGKVNYVLDKHSFEVGKSMANLLDRLLEIIAFLEDSANIKLINDVWGSKLATADEIKEFWFEQIEGHCSKSSKLSNTTLTLRDITELLNKSFKNQDLRDISSGSLFS